MKYYIFSFIGEFGYELFNWQGAIRKWSQITPNRKEIKIVIVTRGGLESVYEYADHYIDISHLSSYRESIAGCYASVCKKCNDALWWKESGALENGHRCCDNGTNKVVNQIYNYVSRILNLQSEDKEWIWSCDIDNELDRIHFGHFGDGTQHGIYDSNHNRLDLNNNRFIKIEINNLDNIKNKLQTNISINLDEPFILCQTAYRSTVQRSKVKINYDYFLKEFNKLKLPTLFLNFETTNKFDSFSNVKFGDYQNVYSTYCNTFSEQSTLILLSHCNIFFSEGDFRSHLYVPPFLGKDVYTIVPDDVLQLPSAAYDFWNKNVFKFGGQMMPCPYEMLLKKNNINEFIENLK